MTEKEQLEASYYVYITRYFLFMSEQEIKFGIEKVKNLNLKRWYKKILNDIEGIDNEFKYRGVNVKEVFDDFSTEKINAIHNTLAIMANLTESECLEIETIVEEKIKNKTK